MKLVSFVTAGRDGCGVIIDGSRVADLSQRWPSLRLALPHVYSGEVAAAVERAPSLSLDAVRLTIPVPDADKIICAGLNFRSHAKEGGLADAPAHPSIFIRSLGTFVAHEEPLLKPLWDDTFDYEAELAVVIGKTGRYIAPERAMEHVVGYTLLMDGTIRSVQFNHSLTAGKNFYRSGAMGPWIATFDEIADPGGLELIGRVNGVERQKAPIGDLVFNIPTLISYASRMNELLVGDVISVGTPAGVGFGMKPPGYLKEGDVFETEVREIGVLRNRVAVDPLSR